MSKPVRIYDATYAEIEQLAQADRRSVANMVQLLLEQALALRDGSLSEQEQSRSLSETRHKRGVDSPTGVHDSSCSESDPGAASAPDDGAGAP